MDAEADFAHNRHEDLRIDACASRLVVFDGGRERVSEVRRERLVDNAKTFDFGEGAPVRVFLAPSSVFPMPADPAGHYVSNSQTPAASDVDPDETRDFSDDGSDFG